MAIVWTPDATKVEDADLIARAEAMTYEGRAPLSETSISLLGDISRQILASPVARAQPQYVALGYWLRPASLKRLCDGFRGDLERPGFVAAPRGVALHLPPTNVDTIFVYSWALSLLAGNCNIVRMPTNADAGTEWLVKLIAGAIENAGESDRHIFCQLPQSGALNDAVSACCDLRMIWGGDEKVAAVNLTPIRPDGLSIGFPDRKSISVIAANAYRAADAATRDALAGQFFNDIYWFDQMGCGSPRILFWLGQPEDLADDLFVRLDAELSRRSYAPETGVSIGKFALLNDLLAEGVGHAAQRYSAGLDIIDTHDPSAAMSRTHGGGFLAQTVVDNVSQIAACVTRKVQTIGYFGLDKGKLQELAHGIAGRGGYRIVPIGQALQFDSTWDGVPLLAHMTRRIQLID